MSNFSGQQFTEIGKVQNYILFIKTEEECDAILRKLILTSSWNPHAKFHIFVDYLDRNWVAFVTYVLATFWKELVINIIVNIAVNETVSHTKVRWFGTVNQSINQICLMHSATWQILTWMPYDAGNCGNQPDKFVEVGACQHSTVWPLQANLFPNKIPRDLNRCPLRIVATNNPPKVVVPPGTNASVTMAMNIPVVNLTDGIEVKLIQTIADNMNLDAVFM